MKKAALLVIPVLMMFLFSGIAWADAGDNILRFGLRYVNPTGDLSETQSDSLRVEGDEPGQLDLSLTGNVEPDYTIGFGVGYEYMMTDLIGIDFFLGYSDHDVETTISGSVLFTPDDPLVNPESATITGGENGKVSIIPVTVGVNFHVYQSDYIDIYFGPFAGYVFYGDLEYDQGYISFTVPSLPAFEETFQAESLAIKDDFTFGGVIGIDVPFGGQGWMFSGALKYFKTKAEIDEQFAQGAEDLDVDPWEVFVGFGYIW